MRGIAIVIIILVVITVIRDICFNGKCSACRTIQSNPNMLRKSLSDIPMKLFIFRIPFGIAFYPRSQKVLTVVQLLCYLFILFWSYTLLFH